MSETSTFTTEGFKDIPNTYFDMIKVKDVSEWPDERLESELLKYETYVNSKDILPRAQKEAEKIVEYLLFEYQWRQGFFAPDVTPDMEVAV